MSDQHMTGAEAAIAQLVAEGITHILGIPGDHNIALCDTVLDYPQLAFLTGRHEHGLVSMANGYSRATHRIAVPLVVSGPGLTNSLTALGDAHEDSVPMVAITACPGSTRGAGAFHALRDQSAVIAAVAKWSTRADSPEAVPGAIRMAFIEAYRGRPGPAVVEIPLDVQSMKGRVDIFPSESLAPRGVDRQESREAARMLAQAMTPVVCAGRGAVVSGATDLLKELVERLQAPCFLTAHGKGLLSAEHPLNVSWGLGRGDFISRLVAQSDVALVIGSSLDYADAGRLGLDFPGRLIQIDTSADSLGATYPVDLGLNGDASLVLEQILSALDEYPTPGETRSLPPAIADPDPESDEAMGFPAYKAAKLETLRQTAAWQYMQAIQRALTDDTLIFGDPARCNGWGVAFLDRNQPGTYHCSRNFCTLGFSLAAAMGAKLAEPQRRVLAMIGDGGLLFSNGDLATAVQYGINVVTVLFNDAGYGSIRRAQRDKYGRTVGVDLHNPNFIQLCQAFGVDAVRVGSPEALTEALKQAWASGKPWVIEIPMQPNDPGFDV